MNRVNILTSLWFCLCLWADHAIASNAFEVAFLTALPKLVQEYNKYHKAIAPVRRQLELSEHLPRIEQNRLRLQGLRYWSDYMRSSIEPLVQRYAWAIPNAQALQVLQKYSPLVEIGAGGGYWAFLLHQQGTDIVAYDKNVDAKTKQGKRTLWFNVQPGDARSVLQHQDRTLFLCWPPNDPGNPLAADCLKLFTGNYVIYVGEGRGGATGEQQMFKLLAQNFKKIEIVELPHWPGYNDKLIVYKRRVKRNCLIL